MHTFEGSLGSAARLAIVPVHDWAIEAMFDRLALALVHRAIPRETPRPMPFLARQMYDAMKARRGLGALAMAAK